MEFDFCCVAWKRRTGLAPLIGPAFSSAVQKWEPRTLTIQGNFLCYYENGHEDGPPRGQLDIVRDQVQITIVAQQQQTEDEAPSPHEVDITATLVQKNNRKVVWKFCFDQQEDLMVCLGQIHRVLETGGVYQPKSLDRFEHDFVQADHIYRWEMIVMPPVIYPIQIHGIVLEAGRNCIVVADFGLTGYSRKKGKEFNHVDDQHNNMLKAAFNKLRPDQDQRLHISTIIDPKEIRRWFKARYDEESFLYHTKHSKAIEVMSEWFGKLRINRSADPEDEESSLQSSSSYTDPVVQMTSSSTDEAVPPEPKKRQTPPTKANEELPQSDPAEIVLERTNFLFENMDVLPPYHVFYSNSECIAVWCKTGRWSTLQTAVFLSTNSVGAAKSSTLATLGVAAANPLLAPVVALGGLVWVTAPMFILKKSREKWSEITTFMTDAFWASAPPKVFVAALQHWSGLVRKTAAGHIVAVETVEDEDGQIVAVVQEGAAGEGVASPTVPPPMAAPPPPPPPVSSLPEPPTEDLVDTASSEVTKPPSDPASAPPDPPDESQEQTSSAIGTTPYQ